MPRSHLRLIKSEVLEVRPGCTELCEVLQVIHMCSLV